MRMRIPVGLAAAVWLVAPSVVTAAPPPGALLGQFAQNQLQNCAAICPYAAQGVVTVPVGAVTAPLALLQTAAATGDPFRAVGAAARSVTAPADAAMTGIIGNDLNQVVPRFQNGVLIGMVHVLRFADGTGSVDGMRSDLLAALQEPLPPVAPTPPPLTTPPPFAITPAPSGPLQVAAVEAANAFFAAAFYVPELSLLGATQTANAAASTLASTGDPVAAVRAGANAAGAVATENAAILERTLTRASAASIESPGAGRQSEPPTGSPRESSTGSSVSDDGGVTGAGD
ncbi:hypothetical protein [Tsukamurella strandjordii]|uniref:DUF4439 domain-containing protein n=1 Tax=Tsukamurella strandjordii TaxID=147577 RepID=A0AA90N998_9ACTN|nr:hypothetical protein [Tsukamurella strandjordii]MDP0398147.1 hypothetical protein [Tsukamurella strandjordii]